LTTIPQRLLRETVSVAPLVGEGAYGPVYGEIVDVPCRASHLRQLVRNASGEEVVSELTLYVKPSDAYHFPVGSTVECDGYASTVLAVAAQGRPGEIFMVRVTCS
jgi:hypothetical protein